MPKITKFRRIDSKKYYKSNDVNEKVFTLVQKKDGSYQIKVKLIVHYYLCRCCDCPFNITGQKDDYNNHNDEYITTTFLEYNIKLGHIQGYLAEYIFNNLINQGECQESFGQVEFATIEADFSKYISYVNNCKEANKLFNSPIPNELVYSIMNYL